MDVSDLFNDIMGPRNDRRSPPVMEDDDLEWLNELAEYLPKGNLSAVDADEDGRIFGDDEEEEDDDGELGKEEELQEEEDKRILDSFKINSQCSQLLFNALGDDDDDNDDKNQSASFLEDCNDSNSNDESWLSTSLVSGLGAGGEGFDLGESLLFSSTSSGNNESLKDGKSEVEDDGDLFSGLKKRKGGGKQGRKKNGKTRAEEIVERGVVADLMSFIHDEKLIDRLLRKEQQMAKQRIRNRKWRDERRGEYRCDTCEKILKDPEGLMIHINGQHPSGLMPRIKPTRVPTPLNSFPQSKDCEHCLFSTIWRADFRRHVHRHNYRERSFPCRDCNMSFFDQNALKRHTANVHDHRRPYICDFCSKAFKSSHHLLRHQRDSHLKPPGTDETKPKYDKDFQLKPGIPYVICDTCLQWQAKKELPTHKCLRGQVVSSWKWKRPKKRYPKTRYKCPKCDRTFTKWTARDTHLERYHETAVKCEKCPVVLPPDQIEIHRRKHENGRFCTLCPAVFVRSSGLRKHMLEKHPVDAKNPPTKVETRIKCEDCPNSFANTAGYFSHRRIIHGVQVFESAAHPCSHCHKRYRDKSHRDHHERQYHSEDAVTCSHCQQQFPPNVLKKHTISLHTGKYPCTKCPRRYQLPESLTRHLTSFHAKNSSNLSNTC